MKSILLTLIAFCAGHAVLHAQEKRSPLFVDNFGEVFTAKVEFVDKPNSYYAQNIVKSKWFVKVLAVNGKKLKQPIVIEYRCANDTFMKGRVTSIKAFEDLESSGTNREWDGVIRQFNYRISHFLKIKRNSKDRTRQSR